MRVAFLLCIAGIVQARLRIHKAEAGQAPSEVRGRTSDHIVEESSSPVDGPDTDNDMESIQYADEGEQDFDDRKAMDKAVLKDEDDWNKKVEHDMREQEKETGEDETPGIVWTSAVEETWPGEDAATKKKFDNVLHTEIKNLQEYGDPFKPTPEFLKAVKMAQAAGNMNDELEPESNASPGNSSIRALLARSKASNQTSVLDEPSLSTDGLASDASGDADLAEAASESTPTEETSTDDSAGEDVGVDGAVTADADGNEDIVADADLDSDSSAGNDDSTSYVELGDSSAEGDDVEEPSDDSVGKDPSSFADSVSEDFSEDDGELDDAGASSVEASADDVDAQSVEVDGDAADDQTSEDDDAADAAGNIAGDGSVGDETSSYVMF